MQAAGERATAAPIIEGRALTKVYAAGAAQIVALRGVDVALHPGELVVLLGISGSGKSTLLNILGGLDVPTSGTVAFRGEVIRHDALTQYRRDHVGFVFQFYNLVSSLTARENVALVTDIAAAPMAPADALALVGLKERANHFPSQLSGGEQQRVAIARAIAKRPELLLCDEPTGALDVGTGRVVLEAIVRVNREVGAATAVITHNAAIAAIADRVLTLADGRIVREEQNAERASPADVRW